MGRLLPTFVAVVVACLFATPAAAGASRAEDDLVSAVNAARQARGLAPVRRAPSLARSARRYSRWQLRNSYFGHQASIRMSRRFRLRVEVLRLVPSWRVNPSRTVGLWLGSAAHAAAILHPSVRYAGAGIVRGRFRGRIASAVTMHLGGR
jgi:uncharacterized protein YkwD